RALYSSISILKSCKMIIKKLPLLICKKFSILFQESTVFNLEECEQSELFFEGIKCFFTSLFPIIFVLGCASECLFLASLRELIIPFDDLIVVFTISASSVG